MQVKFLVVQLTVKFRIVGLNINIQLAVAFALVCLISNHSYIWLNFVTQIFAECSIRKY